MFIPRQKNTQEYFDFGLICRNLCWIEHSNAYWRSYLAIHNLPFLEFKYEDIAKKYLTYISQIADILSVSINIDEISVTKLEKQRDQTTEEWVRLFREQVDQSNIHDIIDAVDIHPRTLKNVIRLLRKQPQTKSAVLR